MDLRYAIRMLARTPGFTLMAVATLALAIGINTVVFSVYAAVAFHKLGVMDPGSVERLQRSAGTNPTGEFSWAEYGRLAGSAKSYEAVVATSGAETLLAEVRSGESVAREIVHARFVSGNYFSALGVKPAMGRALAGDDRGAVVVSYDFWQRQAGGNQASVGGVIRIQGTALTIVGVAPKSFEGTGQPAEIPDMWVPASIQAALLPGTDWLHDDKALEWQVLARRRAGVNRQSAAAELAVLGGIMACRRGQAGSPEFAAGHVFPDGQR